MSCFPVFYRHDVIVHKKMTKEGRERSYRTAFACIQKCLLQMHSTEGQARHRDIYLYLDSHNLFLKKIIEFLSWRQTQASIMKFGHSGSPGA